MLRDYVVRFAASVLLAIVVIQGSCGEDSAATGWQERIDKEPHSTFDSDKGGILSSLCDYEGKCQIHMTYDPAKPEELRFRFVRNGKEILALEGHFHTVFRTDEEIMYFADFDWASDGCTLVAYDLKTGRCLWRTQLKAVGPFDHSLYRNHINMELAPGVICVRGYESGGDYIEIVDRKTGKTLAHRVFASAPPANKK
jgi:hypothetical protein